MGLGLLNTYSQRPLSWEAASQFLQTNFLASSSTPSINLDFGLSRPHWPSRFVHNIFLGNSFSSIRTKCPFHLSQLDFITLTIFRLLYISCHSLLQLFRHCPSFKILTRNSWLYNTVPLHLMAAVHCVREAHTFLPRICPAFRTHIERAWWAGIVYSV